MSVTTRYLCHECGCRLAPILYSKMLWCRICGKRRRVPTHPALTVR